MELIAHLICSGYSYRIILCKIYKLWKNLGVAESGSGGRGHRIAKSHFLVTHSLSQQAILGDLAVYQYVEALTTRGQWLFENVYRGKMNHLMMFSNLNIFLLWLYVIQNTSVMPKISILMVAPPIFISKFLPAHIGSYLQGLLWSPKR